MDWVCCFWTHGFCSSSGRFFCVKELFFASWCPWLNRPKNLLQFGVNSATMLSYQKPVRFVCGFMNQTGPDWTWPESVSVSFMLGGAGAGFIQVIQSLTKVFTEFQGYLNAAQQKCLLLIQINLDLYNTFLNIKWNKVLYILKIN